MKRREFLLKAAGTAAVLTVVPSLLAACDDGGTDTDPDSETDSETDTEGDTDTGDDDTAAAADCLDCAGSAAEGESNSHGHFICLTQAELDAGEEITYTSTGGNHDHTFVITAAQIASIVAGDVVTIESADSHPHTWDVSMC